MTSFGRLARRKIGINDVAQAARKDLLKAVLAIMADKPSKF